MGTTRFLMRSCALFLVLSAAVFAAPGAIAQQPVFRAGGDVVRVFATVTDRDGRLVTTLSREAFEVRDEGKPQPITLFDNTPQPIRLIVMLDVSGSMEGNLPLLRTSAAQLFGRLGPQDLARLGTFGHDVTISPAFTHDAEELISALPHAIAPDAPTPLWRALDKAIDTFEPGAEQRPVILVLSDGKDTGSFSFREKPVSQAEVIERARRADVMVYAVGMRSRGQHQMTPGLGRAGLQAMLTADLPDPGLARVAQETGGGYTEIRFGEDLGAAFAAVADELHSQYLLGFAPPKRDGKTHNIDVRVAQGGLKARARKSYAAPKE
ncbi:MAG TPA: VWA domain-containing protein [Vicinamibacterales bacterium]|nr:VWA domain-containing protein [Vicinamibacterales bacterium]